MNDKKSITDYYYSDERGDAHAVVYRLFPGIEVAYISLYLCDDSCEKVVTSFPLIHSKQIAEHMPLIGMRGMDYLLEAVDRYYSRL